MPALPGREGPWGVRGVTSSRLVRLGDIPGTSERYNPRVSTARQFCVSEATQRWSWHWWRGYGSGIGERAVRPACSLTEYSSSHRTRQRLAQGLSAEVCRAARPGSEVAWGWASVRPPSRGCCVRLFRRRRELLTELGRAAAEAVCELVRRGLGDKARAGVVVSSARR
jgi:hypothetical protein